MYACRKERESAAFLANSKENLAVNFLCEIIMLIIYHYYFYYHHHYCYNYCCC